MTAAERYVLLGLRLGHHGLVRARSDLAGVREDPHEGERLCRAYVGGDLARFRQLLTEPVRVADLLAAVSSGP